MIIIYNNRNILDFELNYSNLHIIKKYFHHKILNNVLQIFG